MTTTAARAAVPARAVVCAAGIDTPYIRVGRGDPIVLVVDDIEATRTQELLETLCAKFAVFTAAPALTGPDLVRWLSDFIEALGLGERDPSVFIASSAFLPQGVSA